MGKAPAFQFYVKDWLSDTQLRQASHATRGIWIDMLCFMWQAPIRGEISGSPEQICRMLSASNGDLSQFMFEAKALRFCDIVTDDNENVTLRNRRMYRDQKGKDNNALRQQRYRDKQKSNGEVTPPSPTPSPTPPSSKELLSKESTADADSFELPTKDELENASIIKLKKDIETLSEELYEKKIFPKVHAWKNKMLKQKKSERAILHTLTRCMLKAKFEDGTPWAYCTKIINVEDGNYNERDHNKTTL